jgi:hypothetical protein
MAYGGVSQFIRSNRIDLTPDPPKFEHVFSYFWNKQISSLIQNIYYILIYSPSLSALISIYFNVDIWLMAVKIFNSTIYNSDKIGSRLKRVNL